MNIHTESTNIENKFRSFFNDQFIPIVMYVNRYVNDLNQAQDIAQESFIKLWHSGVNLNQTTYAKSYTYKIARNITLNQIKHTQVVDAYNRMHSREHLEWVDVFEEEVYQQIRKAIATLPDRTQTVITLMLDGFSDSEIGQKMEISINTVRTLKKAAYPKLRKLLSKYESNLYSQLLFQLFL